MSQHASLVWAQTILKPIIQLGTFGGSITFAVVVTENRTPDRFKDSLQTFLALGWFFFLITLGSATACQQALSFQREHINDAFTHGYSDWLNKSPRTLNEQWACFIFVQLRVVDVLCLTVLLAFLFLSLSVVAYSLVVGWLAFACTAGMMAFLTVVWIVQNSVFSRIRDYIRWCVDKLHGIF